MFSSSDAHTHLFCFSTETKESRQRRVQQLYICGTSEGKRRSVALSYMVCDCVWPSPCVWLYIVDFTSHSNLNDSLKGMGSCFLSKISPIFNTVSSCSWVWFFHPAVSGHHADYTPNRFPSYLLSDSMVVCLVCLFDLVMDW